MSASTVLVYHDDGVDKDTAQAFVESICGTGQSWHVKNKYYEADVSFNMVTLDHSPIDEPAVVCLVSGTPSNSSREFLEKVSTRQDWDVALVCPSSSQQAAEDAWDDLCLEHGFEYASDLDRIKEALQTHPWPTTTTTVTIGASEFEDDFKPFKSAQDDDNDDEMENLFTQVAALRNAPANLSMDERKARAEAVMRQLLGDDFD